MLLTTGRHRISRRRLNVRGAISALQTSTNDTQLLCRVPLKRHHRSLRSKWSPRIDEAKGRDYSDLSVGLICGDFSFAVILQASESQSSLNFLQTDGAVGTEHTWRVNSVLPR